MCHCISSAPRNTRRQATNEHKELKCRERIRTSNFISDDNLGLRAGSSCYCRSHSLDIGWPYSSIRHRAHAHSVNADRLRARLHFRGR